MEAPLNSLLTCPSFRLRVVSNFGNSGKIHQTFSAPSLVVRLLAGILFRAHAFLLPELPKVEYSQSILSSLLPSYLRT